MQTSAGGTGEGYKAPSLLFHLLLEMRLYVHARLGASKNDQLRHRGRMTLRADSSLIQISFRRSRTAMSVRKHLATAKGPEGPFRCHQRR
jgi:hypothetical protein